ncbi:AAA family ATPase [bacterium CPR1]|nr:AAA family ATPase [bacterium CPR1]
MREVEGPFMLPRRALSFVGREAEKRRILQDLDSQSLVLLEGPRGIGKTALALELAHQLQSERLVVWLSELTGLESLLHALTAVLGESLRHDWLQAVGPSDDKLLLLIQALDARQVLLFLDDCHELLDFLRLAQRYLSGSTVLLTSQERVKLTAAERADGLVVRLKGLSDRESEELLARLLDQAGPFDNLIQICRGHPLALKLCASLVREHRLTPQSETPRALIDEWARELELGLSEPEREVMQLLAVTLAPLPMHAFPQEVLRGLEERFLVEVTDAHARLFDLLAHSLRRELDEDAARALHRRCGELLAGDAGLDAMVHAVEHFLAGQDPERAVELLLQAKLPLYQAGRFETLLGLIQRVGPGWPILEISKADTLASLGRLEEGLDVLERVERQADPQTRLKSLNSRCHMLLDLGRFEEAESIARQAIELADSLPGRQPGRVKALNGLGRLQVLRAQGAAGQATAEQAMAIARELDDPKGLAYSGFVRARALGQQEAWADSLQQCHRSLEQARAVHEERLAFLVRFLAGEALLKLGRGQEAARHIEDTWRASRGFPDVQLRGMAELMQAKQLHAQGRNEQAEVHLAEVDRLCQRLGNPALALQVLLMRDQAAEAGALAKGVGAAQMQAEVARKAPYRALSFEGERALSPADYQELQKRETEFDLFLDLPAGRAVEKSRGALNLLSRKILTRILLALIRARGAPLTQEELFAQVWEYPYEGESSAAQVRKNVSVLRDLLEPDRTNPVYLKQAEHAFGRKGGYYFNLETRFCVIEG